MPKEVHNNNKKISSKKSNNSSSSSSSRASSSLYRFERAAAKLFFGTDNTGGFCVKKSHRLS